MKKSLTLIIIVIFSFTHCRSLVGGNGGAILDIMTGLNYTETCFEKKPSEFFRPLGLFFGMIADIEYAIQLGGLQGVAYASSIIIPIVGYSLGHSYPKHLGYEGWKGDYGKDCKTEDNFFYFFYQYKIPLPKEQEAKAPAQRSFPTSNICFQHIKNSHRDSALETVFVKNLKQKIAPKDLQRLVAVLKLKQEIKLEKVSCEINRYFPNFPQDYVNYTAYECSCLVYTKIVGGKDTIEQMGEDFLKK
ncbi:MAG: hypothetical protein AAF518_18540 [Spirochaetota bacterium]